MAFFVIDRPAGSLSAGPWDLDEALRRRLEKRQRSPMRLLLSIGASELMDVHSTLVILGH